LRRRRWRLTEPGKLQVVKTLPPLIGHGATTVAELSYRHRIRPVVQTGASVLHEIYKANRN